MDPLNDSSAGEAFQQPVVSVSHLTSKIKKLLENKFPFIWIYGEISNLRSPSSGHFYFTLKDARAQISAVMFRAQARNLKFSPADGMQVVGFGRISVYEPRGTYQLIFEYLEPKGIGALRIAFEQLKQRLSDEGLFDAAHKRALPLVPKKVSIVTSPSGAVVHDFIRIVQRRFPNLWIEVVASRVQGDGAENEIVDALALVNARADSDVVVLARGGGSLEDLWPFNTEDVARAVFASQIPVVSAVGHETDFTIADFVADLRAPTPSAAGELIVPVQSDLHHACDALRRDAGFRLLKRLETWRQRCDALGQRLINPARRIGDFRIHFEDLSGRLGRAMRVQLDSLRKSAQRQAASLAAGCPQNRVRLYNEKLEKNIEKLSIYIDINITNKRGMLQDSTGRLAALNPMAILARGYSITRTLPAREIVRDCRQTAVGASLEVVLANGGLKVDVTGIQAPSEGKKHGQENV